MIAAGCGYAACFSPIFLGGNFGQLFDAARRAPLAFEATFAFYLWLIVFAAGIWWIYQACRARDSFTDPPDPKSMLWSGGSMLLCSVAVYKEWYLPSAHWGEFLHLASGGLWVAFYGRNVGAMWLTIRAFRNDPSPPAVNCEHGGELAECREVIAAYMERDEHYRALLKDLGLVLAVPGMRRAVLGRVHPDRATSDQERRALTHISQVAERMFRDLNTDEG
jgi:hypothetical protein